MFVSPDETCLPRRGSDHGQWPAQGGSLTITAQPVDGTVEVTIADTGTGIARENLERIMEPLYSTKARGIGLGLAITRSIVEKHGGALRVASELGVGSCFTVRLPAHTGPIRPLVEHLP